MTRRPGPTGRRDQGVTLVETLVGASLSLVVIAAAVSVLLGALRATTFVRERTTTSADLRIAMEQLTRELRVAIRPQGTTAALISGSAGAVSFYSLLSRSGATAPPDLAPTRVDVSYDGTCLQVRHTPLTDTGGGWVEVTAQARTTCLLRTAVAPTFTYYPSGALSVNGVATPPLVPDATGLSAAARAQVQSVEVRLTARSLTPGGLPQTQLVSRVTLTNVLAAAGG